MAKIISCLLVWMLSGASSPTLIKNLQKMGLRFSVKFGTRNYYKDFLPPYWMSED